MGNSSHGRGQLEASLDDLMIQHSCFHNGDLTGKSIDHVHFLRCIICWHELNISWPWYRSIFSLTEEILKRKRIFSLKFLSWGQITFSFFILFITYVKKKQFGIWLHYVSCNLQCLGCKNLTFPLLCDLTDWLLLLQVTTHFSMLQREVIKEDLHVCASFLSVV